jgi:hypothetical protein
MEFLIALCVILLISTIYLFILVIRSVNIVSMYEDWIKDAQEKVVSAYLLMKKTDILGAFEASDEVGVAFKTLYGIVNQLNNDINPDVSEEVINERRKAEDEIKKQRFKTKSDNRT